MIDTFTLKFNINHKNFIEKIRYLRQTLTHQYKQKPLVKNFLRIANFGRFAQNTPIITFIELCLIQLNLHLLASILHGDQLF